MDPASSLNRAFNMDLASKALTVVSTDGSYFDIDTAYVVDLSSSSDEIAESFQDGSDEERAQIAVKSGVKLTDILGDDHPPFVSQYLMYEVEDWVYDESKSEFMFFIPCISGNFWMVDCWIVDADGNVHPDHSTAGVPVATRSFVAVDNSPKIMD